MSIFLVRIDVIKYDLSMEGLLIIHYSLVMKMIIYLILVFITIFTK
jgi:hypothetical protein